jgi:hypothetical protein
MRGGGNVLTADDLTMQSGGDVSMTPYVSGIARAERQMDPVIQQLLFGVGGQGGFIPGAMRAAERTFFDDQGRPIVIPQEVAGFSPDQMQAMELARSSVGIQEPFMEGAQRAFRSGLGALGRGTQAQLQSQQEALGQLQRGAREEERQRRAGLSDVLGGIGAARGLATGAEREFRGGLGESRDLLRGTTGAFDPSMTQRFFDPFEEQVVQQTIDDAMKRAAQSDIAATAQDIGRGGESAFGSRARLGASERAEALGRGLAKEIGGIRSAGFQRAQQSALGEFARQQQARRAASSGLASLAGQQLGATTGLGQTMLGLGQAGQSARMGAGQAALGTAGQLAQGFGALGGIQGQIGQQLLGAQQGFGGFLSGLGQQAQAARGADIGMLSGFGAQQQQLRQAQLDAQRAALLQAQQAPLQQFQSLLPFINLAGQQTGPSTVSTQFAPPPSPLQAGIGVGLSGLGALGTFFNPTRYNYQPLPARSA